MNELLFVLIGISIGMGIVAIIQELRWKLKRKVEKLWDDPQWDATDFAHPAFYRGGEWSCNMFCKILNKILDGEEPTGRMHEPLEKLRQRVWNLVCELNEHTKYEGGKSAKCGHPVQCLYACAEIDGGPVRCSMCDMKEEIKRLNDYKNYTLYVNTCLENSEQPLDFSDWFMNIKED